MDVLTYGLLNKKVEEAKNVSGEKITEAVNTYLDENPVAPGATSEQAEQIQDNTNKISELKKDLDAETRRAKEADDNRIKKFYTSNLGATGIADSDDGAVRDLVIGGKCEQGEKPSPDNPQEIKSVEYCTMMISNADGTETQTAAIQFTLRGIGNVRDELYVYADGTGRLVQRIATRFIDKVDSLQSINDYGIANFAIASFRDAMDGEGSKVFLCNNFILQKSLIKIETREGMLINLGGSAFIRIKAERASTIDEMNAWLADHPVCVVYAITDPIIVDITTDQVKNLFALRTYYGGTNISYQSDNGVKPVINFNYACALENFVAYIKAAQGDNRKFIYDMDERMTYSEYGTAMAYVNAEYAATLAEMEV